jgi:all-trans-retinol 13,14-reductase
MTGSAYDTIVVGSGICGLFTAALLASAGEKVLVLERHYLVGGYAQSFTKGKYLFCAGLHYVFNSLPDEDGGLFLRTLGLEGRIRFSPMDPLGFDRARFPGLSYDVRMGADLNIQALGERFPAHREALASYYELLEKIYLEALSVPVDVPLREFLCHPWRLRHLLAHRNTTTKSYMERLGMPVELRDVLSAQCGNIGIPPSRSSLIAHALNVMAYDQGACFPTGGFHHLISTIARVVRDAPGSKILLRSEVGEILCEGGRAIGARLRSGETFRAGRVLMNGDPTLLPALLRGVRLPWMYRRKLRYEHSPASYTLYIGVRGVDLRAHGFGNHNTWHFPHHDLDEIYRRQLELSDVSDPFLAITTPTLHGAPRKKITPDGCHQIVICTWAGYSAVARLKEQSDARYRAEKARLADRVVDILDRHYLPGIRRHVDLLEVGSPTTNARYVAAPFGNSYGASLTPRHINLFKLGFETPVRDLYLANATAGMPGLGGAFRTALTLYARLAGRRDIEESLLAPRRIRWAGAFAP